MNKSIPLPHKKKKHYNRITKLHGVTYLKKPFSLVGFLKWKELGRIGVLYAYFKFHVLALK